MKYIHIITAVCVLGLASCATTTPTVTTTVPADKSAVVGIDWYLMEIRNGNTVINLDRPQLEAEGNGDVYRLRFEGDAVFGKAAPNTYRGPCKWGDGSSLSFGAMASTMMFAVKEPAALKEHDYYTYLTRVNGWGLTTSGRLELYCTDQSGRAVLVYGRP